MKLLFSDFEFDFHAGSFNCPLDVIIGKRMFGIIKRVIVNYLLKHPCELIELDSRIIEANIPFVYFSDTLTGEASRPSSRSADEHARLRTKPK